MLVTTQYMPYGPLIAGQEYDVDPIDARHWIYEEFAEAIPGVTPIAAAILTSAGHVDLSLPGVLPASQVAEFEQSNPLLQGLGVYMQNGHLTTRTKGFYTITFYVLTDRRINGLASVRINGQDYRSMTPRATRGREPAPRRRVWRLVRSRRTSRSRRCSRAWTQRRPAWWRPR